MKNFIDLHGPGSRCCHPGFNREVEFLCLRSIHIAEQCSINGGQGLALIQLTSVLLTQPQILTNISLLAVSMTMLGLQKLFYGPLRPIEIEQLYEKAWFAVTETCLAMTIFREEVGGWFLVMFVSLLIGKVWGWIGEGRVEILEQQPPANPRLFHARLSVSLMISTLFDISMLHYSVKTVLLHARPNMMVMFAFEFAVLFVTSVSTALRYVISLQEAKIIESQIKDRRAQMRRDREQVQSAAQVANGTPAPEGGSTQPSAPTEDDIDSMDIDVPGWEEKGRWVFYLDLTTGMTHPETNTCAGHALTQW